MFNGQLLKAERMRVKLTQAELASGICTASMVSQIEAGKAKPSAKLVQRLADKLNVPAAVFQSE